MKQKLLLCVVLCCMHFAVFAQNKTVTGTVTDLTTKTSLVGVTISVPGTSTATATDAQGKFSFSVPSNVTKVQVSYLGYANQTVNLTGSALQIALAEDAQTLSDVVVVGYGTQKKKDLTGAIATVSGSDITGRQTVQVSEALQGSVPGVSVTRSSSRPGAGATVQIRGVITLNTNNPLVVVDGIPVSSMDLVNPNDIESLSVLKDAASAAIYGSRGAAGVILITTKRGASGISAIDYNFEYALQKPTALPEYINSLDYIRYFNEQAKNDGSAGFAQDVIDKFAERQIQTPDLFPYAETNWQDLIMTNKSRQDNNTMWYLLLVPTS